jgi:phosphosulfolactate synthase
MHAILPNLPKRPAKPRISGITMIMDKGLSVSQAEDLASTAGDFVDFVKLGFGTGLITKGLPEKIKVYKKAGIKVYLGGTLFEAFVIREKFGEYRKLVAKLKLDTVEVSDGCMLMDHKIKCRYIKELAKDYTVLSEVGSKESRIKIPADRWIEMMQMELKAGAIKVIGEARESGSVGIFSQNGKAQAKLIREILTHVDEDKIIWESPLKAQQTWFIKEFGANVNLGNIPPAEALPLETLRLGLRVDTFFSFLPEKYQKYQP